MVDIYVYCIKCKKTVDVTRIWLQEHIDDETSINDYETSCGCGKLAYTKSRDIWFK
jgi:hypothetical protein